MSQATQKPIAKRGNFVRLKTDYARDPKVFQVIEVKHPWYLVRSLGGEEFSITADKILYWSKGWKPSRRQ